MRLVASLGEQQVLENILEASKPPLFAGTEKLHYLLATPFRYRPREGSRFRSAFAAGVWYGAEHLRSAFAEKSYWRLRFLLDSPGTPALGPVPHTAFNAAVRARAIDLTRPPLAQDRKQWTHRTDYSATQQLADAARAAGVEAIRYESVRDPQHAACAALLVPASFAQPQPLQLASWFIAAGRQRVRCLRADAAETLSGATRSQPAAFEFECRQLLDG